MSKRLRNRQSNFFDICGRCTTAHACCNDTTPPVTLQRRKVIEAYLKQNGNLTVEPFEATEYVFPRLTPKGYCVFHDKQTKKCSVHGVKPETCVAGPITFDINAKTGKIEWFIKKETICSLAGKIYQDNQQLQKHLKLAKKELLRLVTQLTAEELKAILKKDEPETFKIGEDQLAEKLMRKLGD